LSDDAKVTWVFSTLFRCFWKRKKTSEYFCNKWQIEKIVLN